jgi:hypothetical protein
MVKLAKYQQKITSKTYSLQRKEKRLNQIQQCHSHVSVSSMHSDDNNLNKMETITDNITGEFSY